MEDYALTLCDIFLTVNGKTIRKVYNKCISRNYQKYQFYTQTFIETIIFHGINFLFSCIEISKNYDYLCIVNTVKNGI